MLEKYSLEKYSKDAGHCECGSNCCSSPVNGDLGLASGALNGQTRASKFLPLIPALTNQVGRNARIRLGQVAGSNRTANTVARTRQVLESATGSLVASVSAGGRSGPGNELGILSEERQSESSINAIDLMPGQNNGSENIYQGDCCVVNNDFRVEKKHPGQLGNQNGQPSVAQQTLPILRYDEARNYAQRQQPTENRQQQPELGPQSVHSTSVSERYGEDLA